MATSPLSSPCTPSEAEAVGLHNMVRRQVMVLADVPGAIGVLVHTRRYFTQRGRILGAQMFRKTAGDADTTTVDVLASIGGAAAATVLPAVMSVADADGDNLRDTSGPKTDHTAYDAPGIIVNPGDYVYASVTIAEGGATAGLLVELLFEVGA